jgi:hypothetical protein
MNSIFVFIGEAIQESRVDLWVEIRECAETRMDIDVLAEREGFEPSVRGYRTPDFESNALLNFHINQLLKI